MIRHTRALLAASAIVIIATSLVFAAPEDASFPYRGRLALDGRAVDAQVDMVFSLWTAATDGTKVGGDMVRSGVQVVAGEFAEVLGPLTDAQLRQDPLFLQVQVNGTTLGTRQRIYPVPFAMRGKGDGFFATVADLVVGGGMTVEGSELVLGTNDGQSVGTRTSQRALTHAANDVLVLNHGNDFEGGVYVGSAMTVGSNLSVEGGALALGTNDGQPVGALPAQRALAKAPGDVLVLNYSNDFEGGVYVGSGMTVASDVVIQGRAQADNIPQRLAQLAYNGSNLPNILPTGFNGDTWRRVRVEVEGYINVAGAQNGFLGLRPNGATSNYAPQVFQWGGHMPGNSFPSATGVIGNINFPDTIPLCVTHFQVDGFVTCTLEFNTRSGMVRMGKGSSEFNTADACTGGQTCMIFTHTLGAWRDSAAVITSLGLVAGNLEGFSGTVTVWGMK